MVLLNLKLALVRAGLTQRKVSLACGIPETHLSDLIRGVATPTQAERAALMRALGVGAEIFELHPTASTEIRS